MIYQSRRWPNRHKHSQKGGKNHPFLISQTKNAFLVCLMIGVVCLMFFLPTIYFLEQNYNTFRNLAFDLQPQLVRHLEREVLWLKAFMVLSLIVLVVMTYMFISKITQKMMRTLVEMEEHMRQLLGGQWNIPHFEPQNDDDIKELSMTYDYLYRSLKVNTEIELKLLEKINVDPQNREAFAAWKNLMGLKRQRLGLHESHSNEVLIPLRSKTKPEEKKQEAVRKVS